MPKTSDYLMWIGGRYYTIESFIEEAREIGVCRKVPYIPDFSPGKTRIFLVHNITEKDPNIIIKRVEQKKADRKKHRTFRVKKPKRYAPTPYVFGYFVPVGILIPSSHSKDILKAVKDRYNIVEIPYSKLQTYRRGCGTLSCDSYYLVDEEGLKYALKLAEEEKIEVFYEGGFHEINPWIPVPGLKRFRALKRIDGEKLLNNHKVVIAK